MIFLKMLTPSCKMNSRRFIFFAIVQIMLVSLPAQAQDKEDKVYAWETTFRGFTMYCSVEGYPDYGVWNVFELTYSTRSAGEEYKWIYECSQLPIDLSQNVYPYNCSLTRTNSQDSGINPKNKLFVIDLPPGTDSAQKKVCEDVFEQAWKK